MVQRCPSELAGFSPNRRRKEPNCSAVLDRLVPRRTGHRFVSAKGHAAYAYSRNRVRASAAYETTSQATAEMLDAAGTSFCLCHGLTGNADVLKLCAERGGVRRCLACCGALPASLRARTCASPETAPGLMLGRAGIGLFYLRLFDPSVPSVLLPYP